MLDNYQVGQKRHKGGVPEPVYVSNLPLPVDVAEMTLSATPDEYVSQYLLNAGSNDMGVDGTAPTIPFTYAPPAGQHLQLARLLLYMESGANFGSTSFMHLAALANGVQVSAGGVVLTTWNDNVDIVTDMFDLSNAGTAFSNERRSLAGRWTLSKGTVNEPVLVINGSTVEVLIQDDLSVAGIIFRMKVQGKLVDV